MKTTMALIAPTLTVLLGLAPAVRAGTILGGSGQLNGHPVTAYVEQDANQHLVAIGFQVSGAAIRDPGAAETALYLALPPQVAGTPFTHVEFDWHPHGHPPPGIYDKPHFDFHFYTISEAERQSIRFSPTTPDPGPQFRPPGYGPPDATVPQMGGHAYDLTGAEFHGGTFTQTMIYGYYDLEIAFLEPMLTQSYLEALAGLAPPEFEGVIRQPSQYALDSLPTLWPTRSEYAYDPAQDQYFISLRQFTAVPEPSSLILSGMGGVALGAFWRSRVRKQAA